MPVDTPAPTVVETVNEPPAVEPPAVEPPAVEAPRTDYLAIYPPAIHAHRRLVETITDEPSTIMVRFWDRFICSVPLTDEEIYNALRKNEYSVCLHEFLSSYYKDQYQKVYRDLGFDIQVPYD
jgi:hypothetical protein